MHPGEQPLHHEGASKLMQLQPLLGGESGPCGFLLVGVDVLKRIEHQLDFLGERLGDLQKLPSCMGEAVGEDDVELFWQITWKSVTHLDRGGPVSFSLGEKPEPTPNSWTYG